MSFDRPVLVIDRLPLGMSGEAAPALVRDSAERVVAMVADGNLLVPDGAPRAIEASPVTWRWSGWLGRQPFDDDPRVWLPPGRRAFRAAIDSLIASSGPAHRRVVLIPHARHALSDVPSCRSLAGDVPDGEVGFALSPATMIDQTMVRNADDHLARMFESLGSVCSAVLLMSVGAAHGPIDARSPDAMSRQIALLDRCVPVSTPVAVLREEREGWRPYLRQ